MKINVYEYPTNTALLPAYRVAVMQAALDGASVECYQSTGEYAVVRTPGWDWERCAYRIAKPVVRYFRSSIGLFGPRDFYQKQYCLEVTLGHSARFVYTDGKRLNSGNGQTPEYSLSDCLDSVQNIGWVEFDGNMEPFRPKPKEPAKPTPVMGWLLTLPQPYRTLAIKNMPDGNSEQPSSCAGQAIGFAFKWDETPQGYSFWEEVSKSLWAGLPPSIPVPKPKKLVPWTLETAPKGAILHRYTNGSKDIHLIFLWDEKGVKFGHPIYKEMFEFYGNLIGHSEYSTDQGKTWSACGTEE